MDSEANLQRGEALFLDGLIDEAETVFHEILRFKPDHCEALNNLGVISHSRGAIEEAERYFVAATGGSNSCFDAIINLAGLYESEGRWEDAIKYLEKAIRQNSFSPELLNRLGIAKAKVDTENKLDTKDQACINRDGETGLWKSAVRKSSTLPNVTQQKAKPKLALSRSVLLEIVQKVCYFPHPEIRRGSLHLTRESFESQDRECNTLISPGAKLDLTGDITIGSWAMIGEGTVILTHDHFHEGRQMPLLRLQEERGVKWRSKSIGRDVWLHGCTVLSQVSEIPDGVVLGAGAVLTKNPKPYEIWAGNPAKKVGER
jgi:hypothetical protein